MKKYDFGGWATKNDLKCSDGRTIRKDAFKHCDGKTVPLVWNHQHNDPANILGHAVLENRKDGVYAYGFLNESDNAIAVKEGILHGDICSLSIYANKLQQNGGDVLHGDIKEVSLVLAGANPGAFIDSVIVHGEYNDDDGIIYSDSELELYHVDGKDNKDDIKKSSDEGDDDMGKDIPKEKTIKEIFDELTDEQKDVVYFMIGQALEEAGDDDEGDDDDNMKHNVFDKDLDEGTFLSHDDMENIIVDAKRYGSLRDSFLAHVEDAYGINDINYLFPDAKNVTDIPGFIKRDTGWVGSIIDNSHHTPFSRIKSTFANITEDDARAKGYIKGKEKKNEVFTLLKRVTTPQTIYKKQKLDRDDVVDITDFDVVAWIKAEMRLMLDEEIARAILIGDGRLSSDEDKISEEHIRPIATDDKLYTIKVPVKVKTDEAVDSKAKKFINETIRARKQYKGTGTPTLYISPSMLTECLLIEDTLGHKLYKNIDELKTALRVKDIIEVEVLENHEIEIDSKKYPLSGVVVNMADYSIGADKGGEVNLFDDFDIDYNQQKYLIETRISGALTKPYSAMAIYMDNIVIGG